MMTPRLIPYTFPSGRMGNRLWKIHVGITSETMHTAMIRPGFHLRDLGVLPLPCLNIFFTTATSHGFLAATPTINDPRGIFKILSVLRPNRVVTIDGRFILLWQKAAPPQYLIFTTNIGARTVEGISPRRTQLPTTRLKAFSVLTLPVSRPIACWVSFSLFEAHRIHFRVRYQPVQE